MDLILPTTMERKLAKKEKKAEEAAKFKEWEDDWTKKNRADDAAKARKVQMEREREEMQKTSFEKNEAKYTAWAKKDARDTLMIERYSLHDHGTAEDRAAKRAQELEELRRAPHQVKTRASNVIASKIKPNAPTNTTVVYTPSVASSVHGEDLSQLPVAKAAASPKPGAFSPTTGEEFSTLGTAPPHGRVWYSGAALQESSLFLAYFTGD